MIVWEAALAALGIYLLITGRLRLLGREVRGRQARTIGLILIAPLGLALLLAAGLSAVLETDTLSDGAETALTLVEITLVAAALGGAVYLFLNGGPVGTLFWRSAPIHSRADALPPAPPGRMTVSEAARALHVSDLEVIALIQTGTLAGVRVGKTYHVDRRAVDRLRLLRKDR